MRGLHYGILSNPLTRQSAFHDNNEIHEGLSTVLGQLAIPLDDPHSATSMPESWIRGSILIRANSLANGSSGVRPIIINTLLQLLNEDIIPRVPLRGSISASGDLSPLSYLGGVMQGKPAVEAYIGGKSREPRRLLRADKALMEANIKPVVLQTKEGLAIVNGTATSTAVAALAIHEAFLQALISQILTAMSVEALRGTNESFNPFFAEVRPHLGQKESAQNILAFLSHSKLVQQNDGTEEFSQRQDRYSIRTAPQWIGPLLEDLVLAYNQVSTELNSVTDNPLINKDGMILHGGNFQAKSVTTAMEKVRQACQSIGQMLFAQCTELINPATSRGLAPNLVVDEPNESWMWKGTDIMIAALQSELGFLSNPVGSHVQFAEMGNQALNSLALISGRYTLSALDILSQLSAAHLVALCQALDLRALQKIFLDVFLPKFEEITASFFKDLLNPTESIISLQAILCTRFIDRIGRNTSLDSTTRFQSAIESLYIDVIKSLQPSLEMLQALKSWTATCSQALINIYQTVKREYLASPDATPILGLAAKRMYRYVRKDLGVPFFDDKYLKAAEWDALDEKSDSRLFHSMGAMITAVYEAMRSGALYAVAMDCLKDIII